MIHRIRLIHLIKSLDLGGIEKSTILYSNYLHDKLEFVGIYAYKGLYDDTNFMNKNLKRFFPKCNFGMKKYSLINFLNLFSIIKENRISHIHYHHRIFIPFIYLIKLTNPNIKIIYTHHNCFKDLINKFIYADRIISLNKSTKNDLPKMFQNKTVIIPHGIKTYEKYINVKKDSIQNIGYVGRFVASKNLIYLINEFKIVNKNIPIAKLVLVGDGPIKNEMITEVDKLGLTKNVIFKEPLNSEKDIYFNIDILVLPSIKLEGFGIVLLEAMSRGIPVIVSNLNVFNELVINEYNGLIFHNNLSDQLIYLLKNNILYNKLRENAVATITGNYNIENIAEKYLVKVYY